MTTSSLGAGPSALVGGWCGFFGGGIYLGGIAIAAVHDSVTTR